MSEEITGSIGTLKSKRKDESGVWYATIDDHEYKVLEFVEKFLARLSIPKAVEFNYKISEADANRRALTLIKAAKGEGSKSGSGSGPKKPAGQESKNVVGIFRKTDGVNALVTIGDKNTIYCLSPGMGEKFKEVSPPRHISLTVDQHSFIMAYNFGAEITKEEEAQLPPIKPPVQTAAQIKTEQDAGKLNAESARASLEEKAKEESSSEPAQARPKQPAFLMENQKQKLIVIQSLFRSLSAIYAASNGEKEGFDVATDRIMAKAFLLADAILEEVTR